MAAMHTVLVLGTVSHLHNTNKTGLAKYENLFHSQTRFDPGIIKIYFSAYSDTWMREGGKELQLGR